MNETEEFEFMLALEKERGGGNKNADESFPQQMGRAVLNAVSGAVRGAGSIGATLLAPLDAAARAVNGGKPISVGGYDVFGQERRDQMTSALQGMGADPESLPFQGAKLSAEVAGTLGVGGGIANGLRSVPALARIAAPVIPAIESAGMVGQNMLGRVAGGAITGGAAAGLTDPSSVGAGVAIGGALPPVLSGTGKVAKWIGGLIQTGQVKTAQDLAKALELLSPADRAAAVAQLRAAPKLVPGSRPTVAQALKTPQASTLESIVSDSPGGALLKERYLAQNAARKSALEGVAPTNPLGRAAAVDDAGTAIERWAKPARGAARERTSALYESVPQDEAALYLPDLKPIRDKYFGRGVFTDRAAVDVALATADEIGTVALPAVKAAGGEQGTTLAQFVKSRGGINSFKSLERMAESAHEAGFLKSDDPAELIEALMSNPTLSAGRSATRAAESAMGDLPGAERAPVKVTLKEFENLRSSISQKAREEKMAGNDKAARALGDMKHALDDKINQVVGGDGAADEVLPIAWADKLSEARASKVSEVKQFGTGPQVGMFRSGAQGEPVKQGGEVAAAFWGNRPGLKEDVQSFRRLVDDRPDLLGQFRSMVTTEGASTATNGGNLTGSYVKWFKSHLPGIREAFPKDRVMMLGRIAADIQRAEQAAAAGASRGSPTFRNAANALDVGLIGSPATKAIAGRIPFVGKFTGPAVDWAAESASRAKAAQLAALLADADASANALSRIGGGQVNALQRMLVDPQALNLLYRATPVGLAGGR